MRPAPSEEVVVPFWPAAGVADGCGGRLALVSGELSGTGGGVGLAVGAAVELEVGAGEGLGPALGGAVATGVDRGVAAGVGRGVGGGVGRGVGSGVGRGVSFGVAAAARTVIVPVICSEWISQKYGYVPALVNVTAYVVPGPLKPELRGPADGWARLLASTVPDRTVCPSPEIVQVTVSPTWTARVAGRNS